MKTEKLILVQRELDLLRKHFKASNLSDYNNKRLLSELNSAIVVKDEDLPIDIVCIDSEVEIRETVGGQKYKFRIVLSPEANIQNKQISVFSPMAIAILGYRIGSKVQWEMPAGIKTIEILQVRHKLRCMIR